MSRGARLGAAALAAVVALAAAPTPGDAAVLDVAARRAYLASAEAAPVREACLAPTLDDGLALQPVSALGATDGYGSDQAAEDFAWAVMVLAGKALAGDAASTARLGALLTDWAEADALAASADAHDAHFALKRVLLPAIVAFAIVRDDMTTAARDAVSDWLDRLVAKIDRTFDGDVDRNNHRYLADSVLAAWGVAAGRPELLEKARARLVTALTEQLRPDGSFPLEARRGARATWYHRQSLASLSVIVRALRLAGEDPLAGPGPSDAWDRATLFLTDSVRSPRIVRRYAAANYIPGPSDAYEAQDMQFLDTRPHGRHYMAWAEGADALTTSAYVRGRLERLFDEEIADERPLIDEFSGGAGTCFWAVTPAAPNDDETAEGSAPQ